MRRAALLAGLALLLAIWVGPLLGAWRGSFAAHMLAHMGVVALAAPLIAVGFAGRVSSWTSRVASLPIVASLLELVVVWFWHAPAMRALAESSTAATVAEQASFLAAGLLLWFACLAPNSNDGSARQAVGGFALLLTSVHMTLLGALLALAPRPLYGTDEVSCFGFVIGAQQDQDLGGVVMLLIGGAVYLAGGMALFARLLGEGFARKAAD